jgi:predicted nucleic acid-binding protein
MRVVGVAGFLLAAKHAGHLEAVRPLLELLANRGFRLSKALVDEVARTAGEE